MSGSAAEERIRAKGEAMLRALFPTARIIHELMLRQGGCRADLAAVTPDRLIGLEIKSERDVLTRLPAQAEAMDQVCDAWGVLVAGAHLEKVRALDTRLWLVAAAEDDRERLGQRLFRDSFSGLCNAPARLDMLWADELRIISCPRRDAPRRMCIQAAADHLTGVQVRRAVCAALRARAFPRADPAIPLSPVGLAA